MENKVFTGKEIKNLQEQDLLDFFVYPILVQWSDGNKKVIEGIDFFSDLSYYQKPEEGKIYVKSVTILKNPKARVLYETNG